MKLKNKEIKGVVNALFSLGNRLPIKEKWELTKYAKAFVDVNTMLQNEVNQLIQKEGKDGTLPISNANYQALMDCETEISADYLSFEKLEKLNPSMQELLGLEPIIRSDA